MIFLTGDTRKKSFVSWLQQRGFGRIWIDRKPTPYPGEPWGFDNGAFRDWLQKKPFGADAYLRRMEKAYCVVGPPYLSVLPDIVGQGLRSLDFSISWLNRVPQDWPWFLALQDGMGLEEVEGVIDHFAGLFLGGSNRFKHTAWYWAQLAHHHGKLFHYGRAGTRKKIWHAMTTGSDSCDSAFPLWAEHRMKIVENVLSGQPQLSLFGADTMAIKPWREERRN